MVKVFFRILDYDGLVLGLAIIGLAGILGGWWWTSTRRADVAFLSPMAPAKWIVYPVIPDPQAHPKLELPTVFESSFVLGSVPPRARLRAAGFRQYSIKINGSSCAKPQQRGRNWKEPDVFDVAGQLRVGSNRVEATVVNSDGPPALWLSLETGGPEVNSGDRWRASYAGAAWRLAVLVTSARSMESRDLVYGLPQPWAALRRWWPAFLFIGLLFMAAFWLLQRRESTASTITRFASLVGGGRAGLFRMLLLPATLAAFWSALFVNNLSLFPYLSGFDEGGHIDYIRYLQEHHSLPLANQGWEMFQPPLYYLLSAIWLGFLHLTTANAGGIMAIRILGLAIGIAHFVVVWAAARMVFPDNLSKPGWAAGLAAFLPPMLYLSQYVTNEGFAALMVSVCLCLTLHLLKQERPTWALCAALGICLGAAILSKATALLVLPAVLGALLWSWWIRRKLSSTQLAARICVVAVLCGLVGGWHYGRLWIRFGSPLIGNWDPRLGFRWWVDDGYRTNAFYLRLGGAFFHPWSCASQSFADGIYTTLWGDGLLSGTAGFFWRPAWNYDLMAAGYWIALVPTLAVLAGGVLAAVRFVRERTAEWFLLLGVTGTVLWAMVQMSLVFPYYSAKAFYGLPILVPFCLLGALGVDFLTRWSVLLRRVTWTALGLWALTSFASFWILPSSVANVVGHARELVRDGRSRDAIELLQRRVRDEPRDADLQFALAYVLTKTGLVKEGIQQADVMVRQHPDDCRGHQVLALAYAHRRSTAQMIEELRKVCALGPGYDPDWSTFAPTLIASERPDDTVSLCRQALGNAPFSAGLHAALGTALLDQGQEAEAAAQLRFACGINPRSVDAVDALAWKLSTDPNPVERDGRRALALAEHVNTAVGRDQEIYLEILAAAYAESGQYAEAITTAERAEATALASKDLAAVAHLRAMLDSFRLGHPWRQ